MSPTQIAEDVGRSGYCITPYFLSQSFLSMLQIDLEKIQGAGGFARAGVGTGVNHEIRDEVRSDEVHWLDRINGTLAQAQLWSEMDSLKQAFNRSLFLGIKSFGGHYAIYPKGGFYKRHLDALRENNNRLVSVVLYLNKNWKVNDGGELRIYDQGSFFDVAPIGGTLVCFLSQESEHEVLPNLLPRTSFTGWFCG